MNHASLFSGIGGFDLAAERLGWTNEFHCEIEEVPRKVLQYYWPKAKSYGDIKTTDFSIWKGKIDVLTGGFPCQPFSTAGKRKGTEDSRHLWPEMLRAIRDIEPRWIVGENVSGILNWSDGLVFEQVCSDLETEGFEVQAVILPACGVNAPHRRDRVWFIANAPSEGREKWKQNKIEANKKEGGPGENNRPKRFSDLQTASDSEGEQSQRRESKQRKNGQQKQGEFRRKCRKDGGGKQPGNWINFPTQPPVCSGDDGFPLELDGITFPKWRRESIKAYGNAIVPQVAVQIFKAIEQMESL